MNAGLLLSQTSIAGVVLRNRLGLAPLNTGLLRAGAKYEKLARAFYAQYASNEVALIYLGGLAVAQDGRANPSSLALCSEHDTEIIKAVIVECHAAGAKVVVQLEHAGRQANPLKIQEEIIAASAIPCPVVRHVPRAATAADIDRVVDNFSNSARLAQLAGADFLEVHAAHGYLLSGFLSAYSNRRIDEFGGSIERRFRILGSILGQIRRVATIPVGIRINVEEAVPDGLTVEQVLLGIRSISTEVDFLSVSAGVYTTGTDLIMPPRSLGTAVWAKQASILKRELRIPILLAGNIDSLATCTEVLEKNHADLLLMGRALLTDPLVLTKHMAGRDADISRCTYCRKCKYHSRGAPHIYCPINPVLA